ncbi:MAG: hypothetical protein IJ880_05290 [Bacilli bacterium]|nr:hypothetical protein [Bacilli bacterium]
MNKNNTDKLKEILLLILYICNLKDTDIETVYNILNKLIYDKKLLGNETDINFVNNYISEFRKNKENLKMPNLEKLTKNEIINVINMCLEIL